LDYSAYTTGVTIDLGTGTATGTGTAAFIHEFIGGTGENTLVGSSAPNTWIITGADAGTINDEIDFSGFENLKGTANNEDAFVLGAEGSITGTIEGGGGGYDSLVIQSGGGETVVVVPDGSGAGTASYDGRTTTYSGLEAFIDATDPENVVVDATVLDDVLLLEGDPGDPGNMVVQSLSYDFLLSDGSSSNSVFFGNPATSLMVNLKAGDDSLTLGQFDSGFSASVSVSAGSGEDTLVGPDAANAWEITGQDKGTLNIQIGFASVENLIGGDEADTFTLRAGASLSGAITGGGGSEELVGPDADTIWEVTGTSRLTITGPFASGTPGHNRQKKRSRMAVCRTFAIPTSYRRPTARSRFGHCFHAPPGREARVPIRARPPSGCMFSAPMVGARPTRSFFAFLPPHVHAPHKVIRASSLCASLPAGCSLLV
jgi:hypothetical protein